jgi:ribosomal protein S19E (S16A)
VLAASIIRAMSMEAASTSETLVNFYQSTWRNNPEHSHLHKSNESIEKFKVSKLQSNKFVLIQVTDY